MKVSWHLPFGEIKKYSITSRASMFFASLVCISILTCLLLSAWFLLALVGVYLYLVSEFDMWINPRSDTSRDIGIVIFLIMGAALLVKAAMPITFK